VLFTSWNNIIMLGRLAEGESILVQGGTSGVGMATIQIAKWLRQARIFATAGSEEKRAICRELGAEIALDYKSDWVQSLLAATGNRGVDVILDAQAGPYTDRELQLLAFDGRLILIASHLGERADINVRQIVRRRLTLTGSTIRPRPPEYKGRIAQALVREVWPLLEDGRMQLNVCATFSLDEVAKAHAMLDANEQIGKVVLSVDPELAGVVPDLRTA
jgi:NADPH2:quinone reductase